MSPALEETSLGIHPWVNSTHDVGVTFFPGADPAFITLPLGEACGYPQTEHARVITLGRFEARALSPAVCSFAYSTSGPD